MVLTSARDDMCSEAFDQFDLVFHIWPITEWEHSVCPV